MFLGHIGVGLVAKKVTPKVSLGVLIPVALAPDILAIPGIIFTSPTFDPVPWTHGLLMSVIWALVAFSISTVISRNFWISMVIGSLILFHWILDYIAWPMDFGRGLPLAFSGSAEVGLGLYRTTAGSIFGEVVGLLLMGIMLYFIRRR